MAVISDLGAQLNLLGRHGFTIGPFQFTWTDEDNVPVSVASAVFDANIFVSKDNRTILGQFDVSLVTTGTDGKFEIVVSEATCNALTPSAQHFYIIGATIGAERIPLLYGTLEARL